MWISTKQGFRKATLLLCSISRTIVPETHFIKPIKLALVVSRCPSNGPWGTVYVKCMNICELIFFSLFFSWHWLGRSGLCLWHCVWRGNLEQSPGSCPKVDGGMASEGRFILGSAFSSGGIWPDSTLGRMLLAYFLVHGEMNKNFSSKSGHYWVYWVALKK